MAPLERSVANSRHQTRRSAWTTLGFDFGTGNGCVNAFTAVLKARGKDDDDDDDDDYFAASDQ